MVNEGNALMAEFNQQGLALHDITFKQKAVGAKIEDIIAKFAAHEVMRFPKTTITALQDVKSSFEVIRSNINGLESKVVICRYMSSTLIFQEKEMSSLIQNIITRQQHGNAESDQVNAQLVTTQNTLDSIQEQINVTQSNLNTVCFLLF